MTYRVCGVLAFLALATSLSTGTVLAAVIYSDDFDGTSINTSDWTATLSGGESAYQSVTVNNSTATLFSDYGGSHYVALTGVATYAQSSDYYYNFTMGPGAISGGGANAGQFGLVGGSTTADPYITLLQNGTDWKLWVFDSSASVNYQSSNLFSNASLVEGDTISIGWSPTAIEVYKTSGATQTLVLTENTANIAGALRPAAILNQYGNMNFGAISVTTGLPGVPEPGTIVLLTTGLLGLLAYAWKKRK